MKKKQITIQEKSERFRKAVGIFNLISTCCSAMITVVLLNAFTTHAEWLGFLKGKSSLMIYQRWGNMRFKYRNRQFWCRGYYVDTVTYFYGHCFQGGKNFAPLPALLRFMVSKGAFTIIFAPNSVNLRGVRVQGF